MDNAIMDTAIVQKISVGCLLIIWIVGLVQTSTYCRERVQGWNNPHFVNVCQDNIARLERNVNGWLFLGPAGTPSQQETECKCYLMPDQQGLRMQVYLYIYGEKQQYAAFKIDGHAYEYMYTNKTRRMIWNITSETTITYRPEKQAYSPSVCMTIEKPDTERILTVRCEAYREERPITSTTKRPAVTTSTRHLSEKTSTHSIEYKASTRSISVEASTRSESENSSSRLDSENTTTRATSEQTSTLSQHTDKKGSTSVLTVVLYVGIGVGGFLTGIIVCCVVKRKRRSSKEVSKARERTDQPAAGTVENAGASRRTDGNLEADSEYAYIDHCNVTASAKFNSKNEPAESDVYNHLNEVQPGSQSDNVYSTAQEFNTTNQDSGVMAKHGTISNAAESDVYNQLNEVQPGPHSDNVYSTTHVYNTTKQETGAVANLGQPDNGVYNHLNEVRPSAHSDNIYNVANVHDEAKQVPSAMSSQYDSVELVQRKHHAPPESDYNVLSFP